MRPIQGLTQHDDCFILHEWEEVVGDLVYSDTQYEKIVLFIDIGSSRPNSIEIPKTDIDPRSVMDMGVGGAIGVLRTDTGYLFFQSGVLK
jgi:hypothetical protein